MSPFRLVIVASAILVGCATTQAPSDLMESQAEPWQREMPYGVVKAVETKTYANPRHPGAAGRPDMAVAGAAGLLFADIMAGVMADKRYVHTIETPTGELLTQMSIYEFPVGTCVSVGANGSKYQSSLARSKRCAPAGAGVSPP